MRPAASRTPAPDCHVECLAMKLVGELDAGNRHVQFDERGRETECWPSAPSHRARPRLYHQRTEATRQLRPHRREPCYVGRRSHTPNTTTWSRHFRADRTLGARRLTCVDPSVQGTWTKGP